MTEVTGFKAKTIHRLLEVDPKGGGLQARRRHPLDCDRLVVDETSMVVEEAPRCGWGWNPGSSLNVHRPVIWECRLNRDQAVADWEDRYWRSSS
jgi:hypothetical protein